MTIRQILLEPRTPDTGLKEILLVEDNPDDAYLLKDALESARRLTYNITHVDCLSKAIKLIQEKKFHVALLDLMLPDSLGLDSLYDFNKNAPSLPVIVLTGLADQKKAIEAVQFGAMDYIVKQGSQVDELLNMIDCAIHYGEQITC